MLLTFHHVESCVPGPTMMIELPISGPIARFGDQPASRPLPIGLWLCHTSIAILSPITEQSITPIRNSQKAASSQYASTTTCRLRRQSSNTHTTNHPVTDLILPDQCVSGHHSRFPVRPRPPNAHARPAGLTTTDRSTSSCRMLLEADLPSRLLGTRRFPDGIARHPETPLLYF